MNDFFVGIASTLVAALILGLWNKFRLHKPRQPVEYSVEQLVDDCWIVAFHERSPNLSKIDGTRMHYRKAHEILLRDGAADVGQTKLRIRLRALIDAPILIKQILIQTEKREPLSGARVCCPSAGSNSAIILMANLDEPEPSIWEAEEEDFEITPIGARPYFSLNNITLKKTDYDDIILVGKASKYCVSWRLRMEFEIEGQAGFMLIDSKGSPFRTTGEPPAGYAADLLWAWHDGYRIIPSTNDDER